jgi:hypothetical protein
LTARAERSHLFEADRDAVMAGDRRQCGGAAVALVMLSHKRVALEHGVTSGER